MQSTYAPAWMKKSGLSLYWGVTYFKYLLLRAGDEEHDQKPRHTATLNHNLSSFGHEDKPLRI